MFQRHLYSNNKNLVEITELKAAHKSPLKFIFDSEQVFQFHTCTDADK